MLQTVYQEIGQILCQQMLRMLWINSDDKKVKYKMDCYILHTVLLVTIFLYMITVICFHYAKHRSKQKKHWLTRNIKTEKNNDNKIFDSKIT